MSAHTPGPWAQDKYGHVIDASGAEVLFRGVTTLSAGSPERLEMAEANTTLIAAAPELLEALHVARRQLELLGGTRRSHPNEGQDEIHAAVLETVDAAIQKAEGTT